MTIPPPSRTTLQDAPYFPFHVKDWLVMSRLWSPAQKGAYVDLCAYAWTDPVPCTLADDDKILADLSGLGRRWAKDGNNVLIRHQFETVDGRLLEPRLYRLFRDMVENSERRSAAGKKGATARWRDHGRAAAAYADASQADKHSEPDPNTEPESESVPLEAGWVPALRAAWKRGCGGDLPPRQAESLAGLVTEHGIDEVARRLELYTKSQPGQYLRVEQFARAFGKWAKGTVEVDARGVDKSLGMSDKPTTVEVW